MRRIQRQRFEQCAAREELQMMNTTVATIGYSANALFKRGALQVPSIRRLRDQRGHLIKEVLAARGELGEARQTIARQRPLIDPPRSNGEALEPRRQPKRP